MFWQNKLCQVLVDDKAYQNIYKSQNRTFFLKMTFLTGCGGIKESVLLLIEIDVGIHY